MPQGHEVEAPDRLRVVARGPALALRAPRAGPGAGPYPDLDAQPRVLHQPHRLVDERRVLLDPIQDTLELHPVLLSRRLGVPTPNCRGFRNGMRSVIRDGSPPMRVSGPGSPVRLQPPAPLETAPPSPGPSPDGSPRQRSGAPASHLQPVDQGPAFRLARKGLPHGRSRQSSEGPQRSGGPAQRVDGRDRPCVVNALRAQRGPYPGAPRTGLNPPTPLSRRTTRGRARVRGAGVQAVSPTQRGRASTRARCRSDEGLPVLRSAHRFCGRPT